MTKEYLVTGTYVDKHTGKPVSTIAPISGGTSKAGTFYEIADVNIRETVEGQYRVGTILTAAVTLTVAAQDEESGTQGQHAVKLGKQ